MRQHRCLRLALLLAPRLLVQRGSLLSCLLLRASAATAWCEGVGEGLSCLPNNVTTLEEV